MTTQQNKAPDTVIRGGLIVDGTGREPYRGDLVLRDGRIAAIEPEATAGAAVMVDASGLHVAPGMIDAHTHADLLPFLPAGEEAIRRAAIRQGVTTLVTGNCGFSVFPVSPTTGEGPVMRHLGALFGEGTRVFGDFPTYSAALAQNGLESNHAILVGQGTLRAAVVGFEDRSASSAEIDEMRCSAARALEDGVCGLSTGLLYPPGSFADTEEIVALAEVVSEAGALYVTHIRNEMDDVDGALAEALEVGRRASVGVQISHLKAGGRRNHGRLGHLLDVIAGEDDVDVTADAYPYQRGSTVLHAMLPPWVTEGGMDRTLRRLVDPGIRARIRADFEMAEPGWQNFIDGGSWDDVDVASAPGHPEVEGRSVADLAAARGLHPVDLVCDLLVSEGGAVTITVAMAHEDDVAKCLASPLVMVGSDGIPVPGKPHPRWSGSFTRVLSRAARERFGLTIGEAVRKMTSLPAMRFGLAGRGVLATGAAADVVVFDHESVTDTATYREPLSAPRGIEDVIVNGWRVIGEGADTGMRAGQVLTRARRHGSQTTLKGAHP